VERRESVANVLEMNVPYVRLRVFFQLTIRDTYKRAVDKNQGRY
jgi:hypothetical protein